MIIVELFSHVFRPISLGIRLFGNMFADHLVLGIFTELTKVLIPVIFYVLGAFVCVVQAFVFTILTQVYIALAVSSRSLRRANPSCRDRKRRGERREAVAGGRSPRRSDECAS